MKLRLFVAFLLSAVLVLGLIACTGGNATEETNTPETEISSIDETVADTVEPVETVEDTEAPTEAPTEEETTEEVTTLRDLVWETYDPALDDSKVPVSRLISACQLLDHCPLSRLKSANAAPHDKHQSAA